MESSDLDYQLGDLVLLRTNRGQPWPAVIIKCHWKNPKFCKKWRVSEITYRMPSSPGTQGSVYPVLRYFCRLLPDGAKKWVDVADIVQFDPEQASRVARPRTVMSQAQREAFVEAMEIHNDRKKRKATGGFTRKAALRTAPHAQKDLHTDVCIDRARNTMQEKETNSDGQVGKSGAESSLRSKKLHRNHSKNTITEAVKAVRVNPVSQTILHDKGNGTCRGRIQTVSELHHLSHARSVRTSEIHRVITESTESTTNNRQTAELSVRHAANERNRRKKDNPEAEKCGDVRRDEHCRADRSGGDRVSPEKESSVNLGDLVFAKFDVYPHWPGIVDRCDWREKYWMWKTDEPDELFIRFLEDDTGAWVPTANVKPFTPERVSEFQVSTIDRQYCAQAKAMESAKTQFEVRKLTREKIMSEADGKEAVAARPVQNLNFKLYDLVMAKTVGHPPWPAIIEYCPWDENEYNGMWKLENPDRFWCHFMSDHSGNFVEKNGLRPFSPEHAQSLIGEDSNQHLISAIAEMTKLYRARNCTQDTMRVHDEEQNLATERSKCARGKRKRQKLTPKSKKGRGKI